MLVGSGEGHFMVIFYVILNFLSTLCVLIHHIIYLQLTLWHLNAKTESWNVQFYFSSLRLEPTHRNKNFTSISILNRFGILEKFPCIFLAHICSQFRIRPSSQLIFLPQLFMQLDIFYFLVFHGQKLYFVSSQKSGKKVLHSFTHFYLIQCHI